MARPQLVRPALTEDDLISEIRTGNFKVADLMRRSGLSRAIVRKLADKYAPSTKIKLPGKRGPMVVIERPDVQPPQKNIKPDPPVIPKRSLEKLATGLILVTTGITLGFLEVSFDWQFYSSMGRTPQMCLSLGIGGAAIGVMNMFVPASLANLRHSTGLLIAGIILVVACFVMTVYADVSLSATNIGDTTQIRDDAATRHAKLTEILAKIEADRKLISNPLLIDQQIQAERNNVPLANLAVTKDCTPEFVTKSWFFCDKLIQLRKSKADAEDRLGKLDAKWNEYSAELKTIPSFSSAAPGAEQVSGLAKGSVSVAQVQSVQIWVFAILLALSPGFLLAFARTLCRRT